MSKELSLNDLKNLLRIIKYIKKYRKGTHEGSYKSHKTLIDKYKVNLIIIKNKKQFKEFIGMLR